MVIREGFLGREGKQGDLKQGMATFEPIAHLWADNRPTTNEYLGSGQYSDEIIHADIARAEELRRKFSRQDKMDPPLDEWLEALVLETVSKRLFGDITVMPTTLYDDYCNGIDMVMMFPDTQGNKDVSEMLGIDVTFFHDDMNPQTIITKDAHRYDAFSNGKMLEAKYLIDFEDGTKYGTRDMPVVVIPVAQVDVESIARQVAVLADRGVEDMSVQSKDIRMSQWKALEQLREKILKKSEEGLKSDMLHIRGLNRLTSSQKAQLLARHDRMLEQVKKLSQQWQQKK